MFIGMAFWYREGAEIATPAAAPPDAPPPGQNKRCGSGIEK
jgi:hypothetical protein